MPDPVGTGGPGAFQKRGGVSAKEESEELGQQIDQGAGTTPRSAALILDLIGRVQNLEGGRGALLGDVRDAQAALIQLRAVVAGARDQLTLAINFRGGRDSIFWQDAQLNPVVLALEILESI